MKRRQFTTSIATVAGLSTLLGQAAYAAFGFAPNSGIADSLMARGRFEASLGQRFIGRGIIGEAELRLKEVTSNIRGREQEQFHVLFDGPADQALPEGIYTLDNNGNKEFELHLLPGDTSGGCQRMVATINLQTAA